MKKLFASIAILAYVSMFAEDIALTADTQKVAIVASTDGSTVITVPYIVSEPQFSGLQISGFKIDKNAKEKVSKITIIGKNSGASEVVLWGRRQPVILSINFNGKERSYDYNVLSKISW
jgi:hypothetical protein